MRQDSLTDNCRFRQRASSNWHRQSLQLQPSGRLSCGLLASYLISNSLLPADKAICKCCCKRGKKNRKGNGTITHKWRWHHPLFPKQPLNKQLTNWSSCASQVKASGKWEREDVSLVSLQNQAPISEDVLYEYCFLWSNDLSATTLFFFFLEPALLDFPLAQHVGQELDAVGWGQLPPFEEEERKLCKIL